MRNIYIFDEYTSSRKNGIGTYLQQLLCCLDTSDYNICLIVFNANTEEFSIVKEKNISKMLFPPLKGNFLSQVKVIDKFLRLYIKDNPENIFFLNHSPCRDFIKSLRNIFPLSKIVFTIHDFGWTNPLMGNLKEFRNLVRNKSSYTDKNTKENFIINYYEEEKEMYQLADRTICLSQDSYDVLRLIYRLEKDKISLIPNGLKKSGIVIKERNSEEVGNSLNIKHNEKILITIGRPTRQKGIFDLIEAMKLVLKIKQNVRLVIIGDANEQSFRELINAASPLASSITFTGLLDRKSIYKWISIADLGIIPSYYEQFGFVGVEMMMLGLPIIASDGLGLKNMFQNNVNARIARIGNRKRKMEYRNNLANAILELLDSPDLCDSLSFHSKKIYEEKYHIRYMKQKYKELIQSL
ncbi:glycosyltransferase [Proteiniphilum sp.]|uniref:glycosyltransferase n=1 Tax=Proteiniphilum sp. TaxID=1926877 RepID=UPI002B2135A9|nr:glycosyltransferase [Proteiniphilum sp.]MEA4919213.1 glycosyltransferase [Proteiniphilum sp.]